MFRPFIILLTAYLPCSSQIVFDLCESTTLKLHAVVADGNYVWKFDDEAVDQSTIELTELDTGTHTIELIAFNEFGCEVSQVYRCEITLCKQIYIPNSFTPNGDHVNDRFLPVGDMSYSMAIFNRWGEEIYRGLSWDGGKHQDDVYVYQINTDDGKQYTGRVTLIR
jgi:gliding motility-associated-like protein